MNARVTAIALGALLAGSLAVRHASAEGTIQRCETLTRANAVKEGGARVDVHAPLEAVEQVVTNFGSWSRDIRKFEKAKVGGRHGDRTQVYFQVPILKGASRIWMVAEFEPITRTENGTKIELEALLEPGWPVPVPNSLVTEEATNAAEQAVDGDRRAAERWDNR